MLGKAPDIRRLQNRMDCLAAISALGAVDFAGHFPIEIMNLKINSLDRVIRSLEKAPECPVGLIALLRELLDSLDVGFKLHLFEKRTLDDERIAAPRRKGYREPDLSAIRCTALLRPSIDTGIKDRQDFVKEIVRSLSNELGLARAIIDGLDLFYHHKSSHIRVPSDRHMKRVTPVSGGQRTDHSETSLLVEQGVAYNEGRTTPLLLMTGLGIEGNGNKVSLFRNVYLHLPDLFTHWLTPIHFFGFVVPRYA